MTQKKGTVIALSALEKSPPGENVRQQEVLEFDDLADSSGRPIFQRLAYPPRVSLNGLLFSVLGTLCIVFMSFIAFPLPSPLHWGNALDTTNAANASSTIQYTLQLPMALFVAALLGPFLGVASLLLYLALGLTVYPLFANGGGLQYLLQPSFGYLLGSVVAAVRLAPSFYQAFQKENGGSCSLKIIRLALVSGVTMHAIGVLYLLGLAMAQQLPLADVPGWMLRLSLEPLPYDLAFTVVLLCLVRQVRLALWFVLY